MTKHNSTLGVATPLSDFIRNASPERKAEVFGRVMDNVTERQQTVIAAAGGVAPSEAPGWVRLKDSDWVNIVNHPEVLGHGSDSDLAVACAVRLTEARLRELNTHGVKVRRWTERWHGSGPDRGWWVWEADHGDSIAYCGEGEFAERLCSLIVQKHNDALGVRVGHEAQR